MTARVGAVLASAPTRIDLAGGTLDIWPLSVLVPGAVTVNAAIELRAHVRIERAPGREVRLRSEDRGARERRRLPLDGRFDGPLSLLLRMVAAFEPSGGLSVTTRATAPAGAGLGGSSTLAIATGAALARWTAKRLGKPELLRRVMNLETTELRVPTGTQDYLAAIHGGLAAYHHEPDGTRHEPLPLPEGLEERLVLAYTGEPRHSGYSNWDMFRRYVDGERRTVERMTAIAATATAMVEALRRRDLDEVGRLVGEEGRLRERLAPSVTTPKIGEVARAARRAGALGVKICGAGGGGCVVAVAREGHGPRVAEAIGRTGAQLLPVRIARRGLRVGEG